MAEEIFYEQSEKLMALYYQYKKDFQQIEIINEQERNKERLRADLLREIGPPEVNVVFNRLFCFLKRPIIQEIIHRLFSSIKTLTESKQLGKVLGILELDKYPALNLAIYLNLYDQVEILLEAIIQSGDLLVLCKTDPDNQTALSLVLERAIVELENQLDPKQCYNIALKILSFEAILHTLFLNNNIKTGVKVSPLSLILSICLSFPEERHNFSYFSQNTLVCDFIESNLTKFLAMQIYSTLIKKKK